MLIRAQEMHGTSVAFALVAVGLAFFVDPNRRPIRTAIGALSLATAVATHAIDGAFGFATAGAVVFFGFLANDWRNSFRELACLVGALLVAVPEFAVALQVKLQFPILPIAQMVGIAVVWFAARGLTSRPAESNLAAGVAQRVVILGALIFLAYQVPGLARDLYVTFPVLVMIGFVGLLTVLLSRRPEPLGVYIAVLALLIADFVVRLSGSDLIVLSGQQARFGLADVTYKLGEYWCPYFLVFPATALFDWIYRNLSKSVAIAVLLVLVVFPWSQRPELDPHYHGHSLAEEGALDWQIAKLGWWGGTPDTRWAQSSAELALSETLRNEIRAGRITSATHIVHVTPHTVMWQDVVLFSVYTGIDDDLYVEHPAGPLDQGGTAGSRLHEISMLPGAIAKRPTYIVVHNDPPAGVTLPPPGYDVIFNEDNIRLFRRDDLSPGATVSSSRR
jgi:hypothetical protein